MNNIAYIDGQNLHLGTKGLQDGAWRVDLQRFRTYLKEKYNVQKAYYYLGYVQEGQKIEHLYKKIGATYFAYLDDQDIKKKIQWIDPN